MSWVAPWQWGRRHSKHATWGQVVWGQRWQESWRRWGTEREEKKNPGEVMRNNRCPPLQQRQPEIVTNTAAVPLGGGDAELKETLHSSHFTWIFNGRVTQQVRRLRHKKPGCEDSKPSSGWLCGPSFLSDWRKMSYIQFPVPKFCYLKLTWLFGSFPFRRTW